MSEKVGIIIAFLLLLAYCFVLWKRESCKRKIRSMSEDEKIRRLNELICPFGFFYEPNQDVFVSQIHAWQRKEGYEALFDDLAPKFNMVIDAYPVYFDYQDKTWMIEFWKGQYGINTGAETGIYHANRLVPKEQRRKIHYNAVSDEEMPLIGMCLKRKGKMLFTQKSYHWWLAAFRMGTFSEPADLVMHTSITFSSPKAAEAFCEGLDEAGYEKLRYRRNNRRVTVLLEDSQKFAGLNGLHRKFVQGINRCCCRLYKIAAAPFVRTPDRLLFLYEQLPGCFRRMFRLHSFGKKVRVKK